MTRYEELEGLFEDVYLFYWSTQGAVSNIKDGMLEEEQRICSSDATLSFKFKADQMNHLCLTACHISLSGVEKKGGVGGGGDDDGGWGGRGVCVVCSQSLWRSPWESSDISLYSQGSLWQLWYIYLLTRTEIISFHLRSCLTEDQWDTSLSVWSTVTWRRAAGPLRWAYLINWISCQLWQYALCIMSSFKCGERIWGDYSFKLRLLVCLLFWCIAVENVCCMEKECSGENLGQSWCPDHKYWTYLCVWWK